MKFSKYIKLCRERLHMTKQEIASRAQFTSALLCIWERGKAKPKVENLISLEKALELPHGTLQQFYFDGTDKRKIYVSHPLRNNIEGNRKEVSEICRQILMKHNDVLVLSPLNAFNYLSAEEPRENDIAFEQCKAMLELADELWVYGDWQNSEGCRAEIRYAQILKIPIKYESEIK